MTLLFAATLMVCIRLTVAAQQSPAGQAGVAQPSAAPPPTDQPSAAPPPTDQPSGAQPSTEQPPAAQPSTAPPSPDTNENATADQANDANVQLMREDIRSKRKKIIASNMTLTDAEAAKFWPVYDRYIAEARKINDQRYALIKDYAKNYDTMTDDQADDFIERWLAYDSDDNQLRIRYLPEFQKVISHKKTAMFFQVDRRVGMMLNLQLAGQVPLVKP
jgi:hypothetical protein